MAVLPDDIDDLTLGQFFGSNLDRTTDIFTELIKKPRIYHDQIFEAKGSICSYLIDSMKFMENEVNRQFNVNRNKYGFLYSEFNFKLEHYVGGRARVINKIDEGGNPIPTYVAGCGVASAAGISVIGIPAKGIAPPPVPIQPQPAQQYPNPYTDSSPLGTIVPNRYIRTIYQNVIDILSVLAQYKKPVAQRGFDSSTDYVSKWYTNSVDALHHNFTIYTAEYCCKYKNELELLKHCKKIVKYIENFENSARCGEIISELDIIHRKLENHQNTNLPGTVKDIYDIMPTEPDPVTGRDIITLF